MKQQWNIPETDREASMDLARNMGLSPVTASLLIQRGFASPDEAHDFLNPSLESLTSPFLMKDMTKAVERIVQAIVEKQKILVFGDYDVDGITGTFLLYDFLKTCGASVVYHIPHRIREGYSFRPRHVADLLKPRNIQLLVTVDCGSDSFQAVTLAGEEGIDVVITDHHTISDTPPGALAIVNPKQTECRSGLDHLAGVGVVFYLVVALRKTLRDRGFWTRIPEPNLKNACDLVALGTIADIVPLVAENRILTRAGIDMINTAPRPGIKALLDVSKVNKSILNAEDIAFRIAPRLNAAGRIDHADLAFRLLASVNDKEAKKLAQTLDSLNTKRQSIEQQMFDEVDAYLEKEKGVSEQPAIILHRQGWHLGVLGIVAAKLCKKHYKPVILIALDGDRGKGSGRSIPGVPLYQALAACSENLKGFGGHSMAAGLEIMTENLNAFRQTFCRHVKKNTAKAALEKQLDIHGQIRFDEIKADLLDELERFEPYGSHNPVPLFIANDISVISSTPVGEKHRRLVLSSSDGKGDTSLMAMHFHTTAETDYPGTFKHLVFRLQWNRWNNSRSIQIIIEDYT